MGSFAGGANSSVDPALLGPTQYSWASNSAVRDGYLKTRPGYKFVKTLPEGVVQGCVYFKTARVKNPQIVAMIDGKLYDLTANSPDLPVRNISPQEQSPLYISQKACLVQANNFLVCQDGLSRPIVYDGSISFRSFEKKEDAEPSVTLSDCFITAGSASVSISSKTNLKTGMLVLADKDPSFSVLQRDTFISAIPSDTQLTLNKTAVSTFKTTLKFYSEGPVKIDSSVPVGSIMAYGNGRLWVANGRYLYAGDLVGSDLNSEIKFSEIIYLSGGGSFFFDSEITALAFLPGPDTTTGQGDLIVFTKTDLHLVRASIYDRQLWQNTSGMQRVVFKGRGAEGQDSVIVTDRDLYFRSQDGIRSLLQTSGVGSSSSTILSFSDSLEANRIISTDTSRWLEYTPAVLFDSRMLMGGAPKVQLISYSSQSSESRFNIVFTKLISKDFNSGYFDGNPTPAYEGEWDGLQICKLVEGLVDGQKKCYAITCDPDGKNSLYELTLDQKTDEKLDSRSLNTIKSEPISSYVETRRFSFESPFEIKELIRADIGFSEVFGSLNWSLKYSPDFFSSFMPLQNGTFTVPGTTPVLTTPVPPTLPSGFKAQRTIKPSSSCVANSKRQSNFGYMFQCKVSWTGYGKFTLFRLHAAKKDISDLGEC